MADQPKSQHLLNTRTNNLQTLIPLSEVPLFVHLGVPADGGASTAIGKPMTDGIELVLAVYDLDQYLLNQGKLKDGFKETTEDAFRGKTADIGGALQQHEVKEGTGVLFLAKLRFTLKQTNFGKTFVVDKVSEKKEIADPIYQLRVRMLASVDDKGEPLEKFLADFRDLGVAGVNQVEFLRQVDAGPTERHLTLRLLTPDLKRVVLSQMNVIHCPANGPIKAQYAEGRQDKPGVKPAPPPARKKRPPQRPFDLTGFYVLQLDDKDDAKPAFDIVSPAGIYVHHAGRIICGWYYPVSDSVLNAREPKVDGKPGAGLFPSDVKARIPDKRGVFVIQDPLNEFGAPSRSPKLLTNDDLFFSADAVFTGEKIDPDFLWARNELKPGVIQPPPDPPDPSLPPIPGSNAGPLAVPFDQREQDSFQFQFTDLKIGGKTFKRHVERVKLFRPGKPVLTFRRITNSTRLPWSVVEPLVESKGVPPEKKDVVRSALIEDCVEPMPPGTRAALVGFATSDPMLELIRRVAEINSSEKNSEKMKPREDLNEALAGFADTLRAAFNIKGQGKLPDEIISQVRSILAHEFVQKNGRSTSVLDCLEDIAVGMLIQSTRQVLNGADPPAGRPNFDDYKRMVGENTFRGFAAFNIFPSKDPNNGDDNITLQEFIYRFSFQQIVGGQAAGVVLKGSLGAFIVTISKLDPKTKKDADPDRFKPTKFVGVLAGGGVGVFGELGVGGASASPTSGKAQDADITSMIDIKDPKDFRAGRFVIASQHFPGVGVSGGPSLGAGFGATDTVFSITLPEHFPSVTLETRIDEGYKISVDTPDAQAIFEYLKSIRDALKDGDLTKVPAAKGNATLYGITVCLGYLMFETEVKELPRLQGSGFKSEDFLDKGLFNTAKVLGAKFEQGKAEISQDAAKMLELRLAVHRKIVEYPGYMDIQGTASPEWGDESRANATKRNLDLSEARAEAVQEAILFAFGPAGKGAIPEKKDILAFGDGFFPFEEDFTKADFAGPVDSVDTLIPHIHPFCPAAHDTEPDPDDKTGKKRRPGKGAQKTQLERIEVYPDLRRVDIVMNGIFTVRIFGK